MQGLREHYQDSRVSYYEVQKLLDRRLRAWFLYEVEFFPKP